MTRNYFGARRHARNVPKLLKQELVGGSGKGRDVRQRGLRTADPTIEVGEALLEHFGVARIAGRLHLLQNAGAREAKAFTLLTELEFLRGRGLGTGVGLAGHCFLLLGFNGFRFPSACHMWKFYNSRAGLARESIVER
jgi:hypothetical protein